MGQKQTFVTGLADVNPNNKDGLGSIRVENNAVYKYVQFSGTTAVNIGDAVCYVVALKKIPVSIAFPSVAASYAIVAVLAHLLRNEPFGWPQLAGIALIGSGVLPIHQY